MANLWKLITENKVVAVILAVIVLLIVWFLLFKFPNRTRNTLSKKDIPSEGSTEGSPDDIEALANDLATQLANEMAGINITRDLVPYQNLLSTSDVLLEATYRAFGIREGATLKQWINDEFSGDYGFIESTFSVLKKQIIKRFEKLNLN
jgi:hypothetical protein